jgi:hypothetical protein
MKVQCNLQAYKDDKITDGISSNDHHEFPFYDALNSW